MAKGIQGRKTRSPGQGRDASPRRPDSGKRQSLQRILSLHNRQRVRRVDLRLLRKITQALLQETWPQGSFDLAIYVVAKPEMTRLNETYLRHKGTTDVITFDYAEEAGQESGQGEERPTALLLHGEIFVCLDEAVSQARRFHTTWQSELVRYVVHGVLHLLGYDDAASRARRKMKTAEEALVHQLAHQFELHRLGVTTERITPSRL
jgi:probable rRNA maturation factor